MKLPKRTTLKSVRCVILQAQLVVLASQISWSESVDNALQTVANKGGNDLGPVEEVMNSVDNTLKVLADSVLHDQPPVRRRKLEHLVCGDISSK